RVIPLYYERGKMGFSPEWIKLSKRSMVTLLPQFNSARMVGEYLTRFYLPASRQGRRYRDDDYRLARDVAAWKTRVRDAWPGVKLRPLEMPARKVLHGAKVRFAIAVTLNGLAPQDLAVELLIRSVSTDLAAHGARARYDLEPEGPEGSSEHRYALQVEPGL